MSLENITKHIVLDVSISKYVSIIANQYDQNIREIIAQITDKGKPYNINNTIKASVKCKKSDNTYVVNDCAILSDGTIQINVTHQMTSASGVSEYELVLIDVATEKILHTMKFFMSIREAVFSDNEISSTNEFQTFENAIISVEQTKNTVNELETQIGEINTDLSSKTLLISAIQSSLNVAEQNIDNLEKIVEGDEFIRSNMLGVANGVATLNINGYIPSNQLPSYVDDILEGTYDEESKQFLDKEGSQYSPEADKIYIDINTNITYRWSGTIYVEIGKSLALGTTSSTAFAGDRGLALEELLGEGYIPISENDIRAIFS